MAISSLDATVPSPLSGRIEGTNQADQFTGTVFPTSSSSPSDAAAIASADVVTYAGDDEVTGTATLGGFGSYTSVGADASTVEVGSGNDRVTLLGSANGGSTGGGSGIGYGARNSKLAGGSGNDVFTLTGLGQGGGFMSGFGSGYGAFKTDISAGSGNDSLTLIGTAKASAASNANAIAYGASQSTISGDSGDDTITLAGDGTAVNSSQPNQTGGIGYGAAESVILAGSGNDTLTLTGTGGAAGYGAVGSLVNGGNGDDQITVSGTTLDIQDSLIFGGNGRDTLTVGRGSGTIDGGNDVDRLVITYFLPTGEKPEDIQVSFGGGGIQISGATDNKGLATPPWTQTVLNVEQFQVGSDLYSASQFVSTFG